METPSARLFVERFKALKEPRWISCERGLVLHDMMILRHGGVPGVRDLASLEAVTSRPKQRFGAGVNGLAELAVDYAAGMARERPFRSGNAAVGFIIAATFLRCNGFLFDGRELPVVQILMALAQGKGSEAECAHYIRCNCQVL